MADDDHEIDPQHDPPPAGDVVVCPHCGGDVAVDPAAAGYGNPFLTCPHCGQEFTVRSPDEDGASSEDDDRARAEAERARDEELDGLKIRQVAMMRRADIRARSYLIVAVVGCIAAGGEFIHKTVQRVRATHAWDLRTFAFIAGAAVAFIACVYFAERAMEIGRDLKKPLLDEPTAPPDFTGLGEGTNHIKDLENL